MTPLPPWTQPQFEQYVAIALATMTREGVLKSNRPPGMASRTAQGAWRVELMTDLSLIGLPAATAMSATTQADGSVSWSLGDRLIRSIPGE